MADSVEEVEGEESGDTDDDEDEILQDPIEEVPELTTSKVVKYALFNWMVLE